MKSQPRPIVIILAAVLCSASVAYGNGLPGKGPTIDPKPTQILRQMSDYLTSLQSFSVHVDIVVEGITPSGERVDTDRSGDIWVERPNKLRANMVSAKHNVQMYYDGKAFTIYSPIQKYYATWNAPGTIPDMVAVARRQYGLSIPGADLLAANPYQNLMQNVTSATYVGDVALHGIMTHQLAFRQPNIDWQIWVEAGDTPFPRRIVITDKRTVGQPQYMASYTTWNTSPQTDLNTFLFTPPAGAQRIKVNMLPTTKQPMAPAKVPRKGGSK